MMDDRILESRLFFESFADELFLQLSSVNPAPIDLHAEFYSSFCFSSLFSAVGCEAEQGSKSYVQGYTEVMKERNNSFLKFIIL